MVIVSNLDETCMKVQIFHFSNQSEVNKQIKKNHHTSYVKMESFFLYIFFFQTYEKSLRNPQRNMDMLKFFRSQSKSKVQFLRSSWATSSGVCLFCLLSAGVVYIFIRSSLAALTLWERLCQMSSLLGKLGVLSHERIRARLLHPSRSCEMDLDSFLPPRGFYGRAKSKYSRVIAAAAVCERMSRG